MGGRVAEEIVLAQRTTGAANDIERATQLARRMVCEWGMSEEMGPLSFGKREEQVFLGRDIAQHRDYSEQTAISIDREIRRIVESNYQRARRILTEHVDILHGIAHALLEKETLELRDVDQIIQSLKPELLAGIKRADRAREESDTSLKGEAPTHRAVDAPTPETASLQESPETGLDRKVESQPE